MRPKPSPYAHRVAADEAISNRVAADEAISKRRKKKYKNNNAAKALTIRSSGRRRRGPKQEEEEEEIKEMVGVNSSQSRTRIYYPRKCKNARLSIREWCINGCIPDELLFDILLLLPAQYIYYSSRLVCRKWYDIMRTKDFMHKHLEHATYGLLYWGETGDVFFVSPRQDAGGIFDTYKLNYNCICRSFVWSSCNGLMLEEKNTDLPRTEFYRDLPHTLFYVTNVLTDQGFRLPPYPHPQKSFNNVNVFRSGIGYDAASMTYKVVMPLHTIANPDYGFDILTVGVDKSWRRIHIDHLPHISWKISYYSVYTEGFLHWAGPFEVVSLNIETEILTTTPLPIPRVLLTDEKLKRKRCYLSTGRYLSLFYPRTKFLWEVFEMKPETGEWRKWPNLCLEEQKGMMERLGIKPDGVEIRPCGWLKYPEVLALRVQFVTGAFIIFYNLVTCEIGAEKLPASGCFPSFTLHKNSLVRFGGL